MQSTDGVPLQRMPPVGIGIVDLLGRVTMTDELLRQSLGYSKEEFAAMPIAAYLHPDDLEVSLGRLAQLRAGQIDRYAAERRFIRKDGEIHWVSMTVSLVRAADGTPDHVIGVTQDISDRKRIESSPRAEKEGARLQIERIPAIVYVAQTGPGGRWLYVSPQIEAILGFTADEWMADPGLWLQQLHPLDREMVVADEALCLLASAEVDLVDSSTYRMCHRDGTTVWVRDDAMMVWDGQGQATFHGVLVDVTAEKLLEEQLERQAFRDPLTGLPNRKLFHDRVGHALARRHTAQMAVLFVDLDNFKNVNDSFGHACGDEVIVATARRLETCARVGDTAARLGGDEFALLLEDVNAEQVSGFAQRVIDALGEAPVEFSGRMLTIGASIGIALAGPEETTETLMRNADLAMYEAKLQGRSRHVLYEPAMHLKALSRFRIREALQGALADRAITVAYQPIVDLRSGVVAGVEALARWSDRQLGSVSPTDFIPVAEETGLIHELGRWVLEQACHDLAGWRASHGIQAYVSVNVSPLQLDHDQFASSVLPILRRHGLEPSDLMLEVTEGVPLVKRSRDCLQELRSYGVRVAIDDFGTGYSSLSYLRELPVDMVKIDQTFLGSRHAGSPDSAGTTGSTGNVGGTAEAAFLRAIILLAETMNLGTICEGIETPDQLHDLLAAGCGNGQGYLLARPGAMADIPATYEVGARSGQVATPAATVT